MQFAKQANQPIGRKVGNIPLQERRAAAAQAAGKHGGGAAGVHFICGLCRWPALLRVHHTDHLPFVKGIPGLET